MEDFDLQMVARKSVSGIFALVSRTFLVQILTVISNFVLTIYLEPSMFGIFFIVSTINIFLSYFQDIGLAALIVQKKEQPTVEELRTTFTIQQILVITIVVFAFLISPFFAHMFHLTQDGLYVLYAYLISFILSSLKTIPTVLLERKLDFQKLVIPQIAEGVVYSLSLIIFAVKGFGVNTFTIAILLRSIVGLPIIYYVQPWSIGFAFKKDLFKQLVSYGSPFQGNSILALLKDDLLNLYIASVLPLTQVGYIGFGQKWAAMPLRLVMDNVIKVTFPSYSRMQHDKAALRTLVEKSLYLIAFFIFPVVAGFMVFSSHLVELLPRYEKWEPAILALLFFSLNTLFASITVPLTNLLNAIGKVKITLQYMVLWTLLNWGLTVLFIKLFGFNGVAAASFLVAASVLLILPRVKKYVPFSFFQPIWKQFLASVLMGLLVFISGHFITSLLSLAFMIIVAGIVYLGILFLISQQEMKKIFQFVIMSIRKER
ncbi:MAG TPA: oligosaccharide flippase family protein [Candidatus Acidoferrales bacterium]|nr:oligosaccharide flippase family protein [Candidatus Acidoferrales bacterium]